MRSESIQINAVVDHGGITPVSAFYLPGVEMAIREPGADALGQPAIAQNEIGTATAECKTCS